MKLFDILLIKTKYCPISWLIRKYTHSEWNHCAFILDNKTIIDCKSIGIKIRPLKVYLNKFYKLKLIRLNGLTKKNKRKMKYHLIFIKPLLKVNYFRFLITLWLIFINYKGKLPTYTCSGFIAICLKKIGYYIRLDKKISRITPEDINQKKGAKNVTKSLYTYTCL